MINYQMNINKNLTEVEVIFTTKNFRLHENFLVNLFKIFMKKDFFFYFFF